jgi:hypothetical protein
MGNVVNRLLNELNSDALMDSVGGKGSRRKPSASDNVEVIVRKVISDGAKRKSSLLGKKAVMGKKLAKDGVYTFDSNGTKKKCRVRGGLIVAVSDNTETDPELTDIPENPEDTLDLEDLEELELGNEDPEETVVHVEAIEEVEERLAADVVIDLLEDKRRGRSDSRRRTRLPSFVKGQASGLNDSTGRLDVSNVDLTKLGDSLYLEVFRTLTDRYSLNKNMLSRLDKMLGKDVCKPVIDGNQLKFVVPVWTEQSDSVDLKKFDMAELVYNLTGSFDSKELLSVITDSDIQMQTSLIV